MSRPGARQWAAPGLIVLLLVLLGPGAAAATAAGGGNGGNAMTAAPAESAPTSDATLPDLEDEVMCPVCGTALGLAESPQANKERDFIRKLIAQGLTKQQIEDRLVAEYGPEVLGTPSDSGFDLAAWIVPGLAVLIAAGALIVGLRRWRRESDGGDGSGQDGTPPAAGIDPGDEERLDADLSRYEL